MKRLAATGLVAALAAMLTTTAVAALARAAGVDFEIQDGETIPLSGITFQTAVWSLVGTVLAVALRRWNARPARRFVQTSVTLTAISLVAPLLSGGDVGTVATLLTLHLVAAAVVIPSLARTLQATR